MLFLVIIEWNILNVVDIMSVYVTKNMSILGNKIYVLERGLLDKINYEGESDEKCNKLF